MSHPALHRVAHRPWELPARPWSWRQSWADLLFAHWPTPRQMLERFVPRPLRVQEFDGTSWVGLVPFRMKGVMRRPLPDLPWISAFPEMNVRLYVEHEGKPGVWFLSLDAASALAVWAARTFFHLPYHDAWMRIEEREETIRYASSRKGGDSVLRARYRARSDVYESSPGSLEHFLTERYCLYAQAPDGAILRNDVHHVPWPLQKAEAEFEENTVLSSHGLALQGPPLLLHFARRVDVVVWNAERVA